jgi:transposase InsO family protein
MKTKINKMINECETCLQSKYERHPYQIPFSGPLLAKRPFDVIHIDTFSFDNNKFLTIIDLFSKYSQAYFVTDLSAITILNKLRYYFAHHKYPTKIVCDEGKEFKNSVFQEFCKLFKINLHFTTNYNPSSNSPIERVHSTLLEKLRTLKIENPNESPQNLMISAVLIYNQSIHSTTGYTPFSLLYGPYENLNAHELDLDKTIYETYNDKRKGELLPFYEQLYQKQLDRGTKILENRNKNLKDKVQIKEPAVYVKKQKIRKADPCYEKVNVTSTNKNKIIGKKEKSKFTANAHPRNIKRLRKTFSLQTNPPGDQPGPSTRKDPQ